jgi:hypothetical protein
MAVGNEQFLKSVASGNIEMVRGMRARHLDLAELLRAHGGEEYD